ncbi:MAG TPA: hypothetical protein VD997_01730 [Phycisphaerales bacterium]|nr:hypothetical protein [Phycisphaerales bacterium]
MVVGISKRVLRAGTLWLAPAGAVIACAGLAVPAPAVQPFRPIQAAPELPGAARAAMAVLDDPEATPAARLSAGRELIAFAEHAGVRAEIQRVVSGPAGPAWRGVLSALSEMADAPMRLFPCVTQRLASAPSDEAFVLIEVMGSYRTRDSVRILGRYLAEGVEPRLQQAAVGALTRLSARDDIPAEARRWTAFVAEHEALTDSQWRARLLDALTAKERRTEASRQLAIGQLVEALRKLHLATPAEERPAYLASLLLNDASEVRTLGFELVSREMSVTGRMDGPVGVAALQLLEHADPRTRASAAVLVRQLAPDGAAEPIARALARETDSAAASDLLLAAARWPSEQVVAAVLRWVAPGSGAGESAFEAARWLFRAGLLQGEAAAAVLSAARAAGEEALTPAAISLLSALGTDEDRARIVPLLRSLRAATRQAAGEALVWYPEFSEAILEAAASDADLFDVACRSVLAAEPTEGAVRWLLLLPRPSAELAMPTLLRTANALTARELLDISRSIDDAGLRRGFLTLLTSPTRLMFEKADPEMLRAIAEGVVELADLELSERQPEAALAALDNAPFAELLVESERLSSVRCAALLGLGQVQLARPFQVPAEAWIRGLQLAASKEQGGAILAEIEQRFASVLTMEQRATLDLLRAEINAADEARRAAENPKPGG